MQIWCKMLCVIQGRERRGSTSLEEIHSCTTVITAFFHSDQSWSILESILLIVKREQISMSVGRFLRSWKLARLYFVKQTSTWHDWIGCPGKLKTNEHPEFWWITMSIWSILVLAWSGLLVKNIWISGGLKTKLWHKIVSSKISQKSCPNVASEVHVVRILPGNHLENWIPLQ